MRERYLEIDGQTRVDIVDPSTEMGGSWCSLWSSTKPNKMCNNIWAKMFGQPVSWLNCTDAPSDKGRVHCLRDGVIDRSGEKWWVLANVCLDHKLSP